MKLLNHTLKFLAMLLPVIIAIWAGLFYYNMIDEIKDSLDDGLEKYKLLISQKAASDSTILEKKKFGESNYAIREITGTDALRIRDHYSDTAMFMLNEGDFEPVRMLTTAFTMHDRYYELKVISSTVEEDDLIGDLLHALIWLYAALLISILFINNLVLRKAWKPFYQLLAKIRQFRLDKNPVITPTPSHVSEFRELDESILTLTKQAVKAYTNQKQFIENAAHELQTPLAISINKLELLAENEQLDGQGLATVSQVIETLQRLTRLNKALLLLSKIENKQFSDTTALQFNTVIKTLADDFRDMADARNIALHLREEGTFTMNMNADLAIILASNLIKNAIVHNIRGGSVEIVIRRTSFTISNTGQGTKLNDELLFERFRRKSTDHSSAGLGMAIVKAIADMHGLTIAYTFVNNRHDITVSVQA